MEAVELCPEHVVADGDIERSKKMNGVVERTRRCSECFSLFKTFELTDDQIARQNGEHDEDIRDLKRELKYYQEVVENIKAWYEEERTLKIALKSEYEFGNEDRD